MENLKSQLTYKNEYDDMMLAAGAYVVALGPVAALSTMGVIDTDKVPNGVNVAMAVANVLCGTSIVSDLINNRILDPREALRYLETEDKRITLEEQKTEEIQKKTKKKKGLFKR